MLGVQPTIGRAFQPEDEHDNVGNRIDAEPAHAREPEEIDDDVGNRAHAQQQPPREADGNRSRVRSGGMS